jgi:hypothetical protein
MILRSPQTMKMAAYRRIVVGTPFPLMGKGRDRGAIRTITPTFVLRLLHKSTTSGPTPIFEGGHEEPGAA